MHTFTFVAGPPGSLARDRLLDHARAVRRVLPSLDTSLEIGASLLDHGGFGWSTVRPAVSEEPLMASASTPGHAALVYGEVRSREADGAGRLLQRWIDGGLAAVQELEGSFSAVIIDRTTGEVHLLGDLLGHRALRFFATSDELIVSPHDIAIAATGRLPAELDFTAAASILACEWSLGGRSMLRQVETCHPAEVVRWRLGTATPRRSMSLPQPGADGDQLRPRMAERTRLADRTRMVERAVESTRRFLDRCPDPVVDLTAGLDSRAALALVIGAGNWEGGTVQCSGAPDSLDTRYGARIAASQGLRFARTEPAVPTPSAFFDQVDLMAFAMNGDTNGKRALAPAPEYTPVRRPHVWGGGGEIFRGYYYPRPARQGRLRSPDDAVRLLRSKLRTGSLPWRDDGLAHAVHARQEERLAMFAAVARSPYDLLDLYYLFERFGVWGSLKERFTWEPDRYWSPFTDARLIRLLFRLPDPLGTSARLHGDAIRRFLPGAYWTPVNAASLLPFERLGAAGRALNRAFRVTARVAHRLPRGRARSQAAGVQAGESHERMRARIFAGPLAEPIAGTLGADGSISTELFGTAGVRALLDSHRSDAGIPTLQVLGALITMERWLEMARAARENALR